MRYLLIFLFIAANAFSQSKMEMGNRYFASRDFSRAKQLFEEVLVADPGNLKAVERLGDIAGYQQNWPVALRYYNKLRKLKPEVADYHYKYGGVLGMIAKESNKFKALSLVDDVRDAFLKAIQLDAGHIEARWALIELYLQLPGIVGGSEKKATRYANELAALSPVDGFLAKGKIAEYFDRFGQAEAFYRSAIAVGKSKVCYQKLADLYKNQLNRPDKAKAVMDEFHNLSKS